MKKEYTIDATGKKVGRLATEVVSILNGKNISDYAPNKIPNVGVSISNAKKMHLPLKKQQTKEYQSYSGYSGGQSTRTMENVIEKHGCAEVLRRAVRGMLPSNRLRGEKMKLLNITE